MNSDLLRKWLMRGAGWPGVFELAKGVVRPPFLIPFYHLVAERTPAHSGWLLAARRPADFEKDLDFLLKHFAAADAKQVVEYARGPVPVAATRFLVTIDDGLREGYEAMAPVLLRKGVPAVFFICPDFVGNRELMYRHKASVLLTAFVSRREPTMAAGVRSCLADHGIRLPRIEDGILAVSFTNRRVLDLLAPIVGVDFAAYLAEVRPYLAADDVAALVKQGFAIGAHSLNHPRMAELSPEDRMRQVQDSVAWVARTFGQADPMFAFPFDAKAVSLEFLRQLNTKVAAIFGAGRPSFDGKCGYFDRVCFEEASPARDIAGFHLLKSGFLRRVGD